MMSLEGYTTEELCEIYENLNSWKWDDRIGRKPEGWDKFPKYNYHWYHKLIRRRTKMYYIEQPMEQIENVVPKKEILRYHNVHVLGETNEDFEKWWKEISKCYPSLLQPW